MGKIYFSFGKNEIMNPLKTLRMPQKFGNFLLVYDHEKGYFINPLSANPTKWPNTPKQFVGKLLTNCLSVFDHFVKLALKGLRKRCKMTDKGMRNSLTPNFAIHF